MGKMTLKMWLKLTIAKTGWSLFIWANDTTEDKYWKQIYEIERKRELSEQESNCNLPDVIGRSEQLEAFLSEYLDAVAEGAEGQYYLVKKAKELKASNC